MTAVPTNLPAPIDVHVPCLGCGYDLFASSRQGLCPECGRDVALSVQMASVLLDPANARNARKMAGTLVASSVFAGLCPASCLFVLASEHLVGAMSMTIAFGACAVLAAVGERARRQIKDVPAMSGSHGSPIVADLVAAFGLALVNLAGYLFAVRQMRMYIGYSQSYEILGAATVGLGFFLLCVTAWRALPTWKAHADIAHLLHRKGLRKLLNALGYTKAIYETLWLACCWMPFALVGLGREGEGLAIPLAVAAAFGLIGFGVIWILMIVAHAVLLVQINRQIATIRS